MFNARYVLFGIPSGSTNLTYQGVHSQARLAEESEHEL